MLLQNFSGTIRVKVCRVSVLICVAISNTVESAMTIIHNENFV